LPLAPHDEKPAAQVTPQTPLVQLGVMFVVEQTTPCGVDPAAEHPPQLLMSVLVLTSHPFDAWPSQSAKPVLQVYPQVPGFPVLPLQVAVAFDGAVHWLGSVHPVTFGAQPALPQAKVELGVVFAGQLQPAGLGLPAGY
jgi:hypothetical protein